MFSYAFGVKSKEVLSEYLILEMQYSGTYIHSWTIRYLGSFSEGIEIILHEAQ